MALCLSIGLTTDRPPPRNGLAFTTTHWARAITGMRFTFRNEPLNICLLAESSCSAPLISLF